MRRVILAIVSTVVALVMLLSFKTHPSSTEAASPAAVSTTGTNSGSAATGTSNGTAGSKATKRKSSASHAAKATPTTTVTGSAANTQYGPVQVKITIKNGSITSASAIIYPENDSRDQQINAFAIPALNQEASQAGNAHINTISGATYTSAGYIASLQSALDQATS